MVLRTHLGRGSRPLELAALGWGLSPAFLTSRIQGCLSMVEPRVLEMWGGASTSWGCYFLVACVQSLSAPSLACLQEGSKDS